MHPEEIKKDTYHTRCHDCGKFLKKNRWVSKVHPWKQHALCLECHNNYDHPYENY